MGRVTGNNVKFNGRLFIWSESLGGYIDPEDHSGRNNSPGMYYVVDSDGDILSIDVFRAIDKKKIGHGTGRVGS